MPSRFVRTIALVLLLLVAIALAARPYVDRLLFAATEPRPIEARGTLADAEHTSIDIFQRASPSVVQVVGRRTAGAGQAPLAGPGRTAMSGSGFLWDAAGHVVTNNHVVQGVQTLLVRLASGNVVQSEVVGTAPNYDLAVIWIRGGTTLPPPIAVGTSADLKVGQFAYAIGNPFGLDQSLTTGVISALKRRLPMSGGREIAGVIQTDAAINPGNSGGPLLDSSGRLIGVTTAIFSSSGSNAGIGFAVPVDVVNRVVPELIRNGRVATPGIGIVAANEATTARLGIDGVAIVRTSPGSPADRAGLQGIDSRTNRLGDVIVAADGSPVHHLSDLTERLAHAGVGRKITLTVNRNGQSREVEAVVVDIGQTATSG